MRHRRQRGGNTQPKTQRERDTRGWGVGGEQEEGKLRQKETGREKGKLRPKETHS